MGEYTVTQTKSNLVFYTSLNRAYFITSGLTYQIVHVNHGGRASRFSAVANIIKTIECGEVKNHSDLMEQLKPQLKYQYTQSKPWREQTNNNGVAHA